MQKVVQNRAWKNLITILFCNDELLEKSQVEFPLNVLNTGTYRSEAPTDSLTSSPYAPCYVYFRQRVNKCKVECKIENKNIRVCVAIVLHTKTGENKNYQKANLYYIWNIQ